MQRLAGNALAVHEGAVAAGAILKDVFTLFEQYAGVGARRAGVADNEIAVRLAADTEGYRLDANAGAVPIRVDHREGCRFARQVWLRTPGPT
ncbi:MAG: hypothetical protein WDO73_05480 [Ignavibacteriota bacterium]